MKADEHTENLMRNLYNIDVNKDYKKDVDGLEKTILDSYNKRACSGKADTDEIQYESIHLCTNKKECTYKKYLDNIQECTYLIEASKTLMDFYNKK